MRKASDRRVEFADLAAAVWQALAKQPLRVGDMGHLGGRTELLDVVLQAEVVCGVDIEKRWICQSEVAEERCVRGVDREPELRYPRAPLQEVAPVPADWRQEHSTLTHPEHWWHVLTQRPYAAAETGFGVEAQEALALDLVCPVQRTPVLVRGHGDIQVDREHGRADARGELGAPFDAATSLLVE